MATSGSGIDPGNQAAAAHQGHPSEGVTDLSFAPDGQQPRLLRRGLDRSGPGTVVGATPARAAAHRPRGPGTAVRGFSPDGKTARRRGRDLIKLSRPRPARGAGRLTGHRTVNCGTRPPRRRSPPAAADHAARRLWDLATGKVLATLRTGRGSSSAVGVLARSAAPGRRLRPGSSSSGSPRPGTEGLAAAVQPARLQWRGLLARRQAHAARRREP